MDMKTSPLALLNDPTLLKTDGLINGQWVVGISRFDVNDPATGLKLADVANLGPADAEGEVAYGASFVEWFAEEAKRINGETLPQFDNSRRLLVLKQPIGVCAAITPWNFPLAMITRKVAPALAAGCPVVIKPAELTPLTALAAAELALRAGIPAGVFNILPADSDNSIAIGKVLCASDVVRHISFTGSTEVGRILMAQSAPTSLAH